MGVNIQCGKGLLFPLTSPPAKPIPIPPENLIAKTLDYGDRQILVTIPFPDTVELVVPITNETLAVPDLSKKPLSTKYAELDQDIMSGLLETKYALPPWMTGSVKPSKHGAEFFAQYNPDQKLSRARLALSRTQCADFGAWHFRMEFSPSKAGPAGLVQLIAAIEAVLPWANVEKLFWSMVVARIDAAIDCIGAWPLDLIAHIPKPGKRLVYHEATGQPATVYFYEQKESLKSPPAFLSSVKTTGPMRLKLYERRNYHRQLALDPPYGPAPVTRVEVVKRWNKARPKLCDVGTLANLFSGRRVAYAAAVPEKPSRRWQQFCYSVFGSGLENTYWSWFPGPAPKFAKLYETCVGDLVDDSCWAGWQRGLKNTGLDEWIAAASKPE